MFLRCLHLKQSVWSTRLILVMMCVVLYKNSTWAHIHFSHRGPWMHHVNTNPVHSPALPQRVESLSPQTDPSITSRCTSLQSCSSCTLQMTHRYFLYETKLLSYHRSEIKYQKWGKHKNKKKICSLCCLAQDGGIHEGESKTHKRVFLFFS